MYKINKKLYTDLCIIYLDIVHELVYNIDSEGQKVQHENHNIF